MSDREPTPRPGGRSGMSVSGTLSIIVAAVAVILGFLILRDINDSGDSSGGGGDSTETSTTLPGGANNTQPTTPDGSTTAPTTPAALKPYTVIVANAAKVNGAAGQMTTALQGISVQTLPAVNSSVTAAEATTTIFYNPTYELEAQDLATKMGATATAPMPTPPPIESGASLGAANLLVQLGTDLAGKPLPVAGATADTTAPPST